MCNDVLPTALAATAFAGLVAVVARQLRPALPIWIPIAVSVTSPWLFHYGQSGFRACSSLLFVPLVALFMHGAEERPSRAIAAGSLAALSVYFYTSNRLNPVALAAACLVRWSCARERRPNPEGARRLRAISALRLLGGEPTPACVSAP